MSTLSTAPVAADAEDREIYQQLARLQAVYKQMFELRTLLPEKLVNPTRAILQPASRSAPEKLAAQLKEAAVNGSKDIQKFKKDYHSDAMRELFEKINAAEIPQGQDAWTTDYVALAQNRNGADNNPTASGEPSVAVDDSITDVEAIKQFREAHSEIEVNVLDEASGLPIELILPPITLRVSESSERSDDRYTVSLKDGEIPSKMSKEIVRYVQIHHARQRLPVLLSLLASYFNLESQKCDKCDKIFDSSLEFPYARKQLPPTPNKISPLGQYCTSIAHPESSVH